MAEKLNTIRAKKRLGVDGETKVTHVDAEGEQPLFYNLQILARLAEVVMARPETPFKKILDNVVYTRNAGGDEKYEKSSETLKTVEYATRGTLSEI